MAENDNLDTHGKASRMSLNRKAELLNCSNDGTFVMKFYEDGLADKAEEYIKKDSPIDEHEVIVCNDIIAVCTNTIGRSSGLADELLSLFNHGNIENVAENENFETLGDAFAKYPQSTLIMRKQYVDEKDARIADLQKTNATIANNAVIMNRKIDILEADKKKLESKYLDRLEEAEKDECELYHMKADQVLCDLLNELGFGALVERYNSKSKLYAQINRMNINPEAYNDALQKIQDTGHPVFIPGSPFVSIEARCVFNTKK